MKKLFLLFLLLASLPSFAQTTVAPFLSSKIQLLDNTGVVCSGCLLDTFAAGGTTPLVTYSESTGTTPNANPIVLDSAGRATVYLTSASYKFRLRSALGATLWTQDVIGWSTPLTTFAGLTDAGAFTQTQPTAATGGANQNSFSDCQQGTYWTGSVSAIDQWCIQDVLGTGANPTSTLTITHSGSSGSATVSWPSMTFNNLTVTGATTTGSLVDNGNATITGNATVSGNETVTGTLGVTGATTLGVLTAGAASVSSVTNSGNETITGTLGVTGVTTLGTTSAGAVTASGAVTTKSINNALVVGSGTGQFSSLAACYAAAVAGQTCLVSPNWSETFGSQLVMNKNNVGFYLTGAATINMSTFGILVSDGVTGAFLNSPSAFGGCPTDTGSGTPVKFTYTGSGDAIATGTVGGATGTLGLGLQNICVDISGATAAVGIHNFCANHAYLSGVAIIGFNGANTQKGIVWDDCATNNGGANTVSGIEIIRPKIAWQMSGNERENDFGGLRLAGLTSPIAGSIGIDLQSNVKNNFFHGGFISGYITGINFGGTSNFNDFHMEVDLDSGGGGAQDVVFGSGTYNNEVVRTSDVGAYVFTDSGNGNCLRNTASTCVVKRIDLVAQNNNIGATLLFAVPANTTIINQSGMYRVSCYAVVTTAAGTSSTLPNVQIIWTDNDTNVASAAINCTPSSTTNTVGANSLSSAGAGAGIGDNPTINARAGTNINYQTVNYASNPANAMQYALHLKVEYLGQ